MKSQNEIDKKETTTHHNLSEWKMDNMQALWESF